MRGLANATLPSQAGNDGQPIEAQQVSVRVDTQDMTCPNLTTGGYLYALARVRWGCDLWRVLPGKEDDEKIPNDGTRLKLLDGDRFYTAHW